MCAFSISILKLTPFSSLKIILVRKMAFLFKNAQYLAVMCSSEESKVNYDADKRIVSLDLTW